MDYEVFKWFKEYEKLKAYTLRSLSFMISWS